MKYVITTVGLVQVAGGVRGEGVVRVLGCHRVGPAGRHHRGQRGRAGERVAGGELDTSGVLAQSVHGNTGPGKQGQVVYMIYVWTLKKSGGLQV